MGWVTLIASFAALGAMMRAGRDGDRRELVRQADTVWLERVRPPRFGSGRSTYRLHDAAGAPRDYADDRLAALIAFEIARV